MRFLSRTNDFDTVLLLSQFRQFVNRPSIYELSMTTGQNVHCFYSELRKFEEFDTLHNFSIRILCLPTGKTISERGFSATNNTISLKRSKMLVEHVQDSLIAVINGPSVEVFSI